KQRQTGDALLLELHVFSLLEQALIGLERLRERFAEEGEDALVEDEQRKRLPRRDLVLHRFECGLAHLDRLGVAPGDFGHTSSAEAGLELLLWRSGVALGHREERGGFVLRVDVRRALA